VAAHSRALGKAGFTRSWQQLCPTGQWLEVAVDAPAQYAVVPATGLKRKGGLARQLTGGPESTPPDAPELPELPPVAVPLTVSGQHTSLSPGLVGVQPAATARSVWDPESQSSFRGLPGCAAQSASVSELGFCRHASVPVPPVAKGFPQDPSSQLPVPVQGCGRRVDGLLGAGDSGSCSLAFDASKGGRRRRRET